MKDLIENKLSQEQDNLFKRQTSYEDIKEVLKQSSNGKSPGDIELTYEFYKSWLQLRREEKDDNPDIINILTMMT